MVCSNAEYHSKKASVTPQRLISRVASGILGESSITEHYPQPKTLFLCVTENLTPSLMHAKASFIPLSYMYDPFLFLRHGLQSSLRFALNLILGRQDYRKTSTHSASHISYLIKRLILDNGQRKIEPQLYFIYSSYELKNCISRNIIQFSSLRRDFTYTMNSIFLKTKQRI